MAHQFIAVVHCAGYHRGRATDRFFACIAALVIFVLTAGLGTHPVFAILITGDVWPANDPWADPPKLETERWLRPNQISGFQSPDQQTFFEGRHDNGTDLFDPSDDFNENADVIVGRRPLHSGTLTLQDGDQLRYMNLIIGDEAGSQGTVRITGFGALYNNNPDILPPGLPPSFSSVNPRTAEDGFASGFDLLVGQAGTGALEISAGGRAEIHDAVVVAALPGSFGSIWVDGVGSALISGGFDGGALGDFRQMIIGRRSTGLMRISTGGTVISEARPGGGTVGPIGAVIGSDPFDAESDSARPRAGGQGTVTVTGTASKWIVGGSLQIGGFHNSRVDPTEGVSGPDLQGVLAEYNSEAGRGTLHVQEGGLVSIRSGIDANPEQEDLLLAIGRFGRLELAGGVVRIDALGATETRPDTIQLINDGVIAGSGRIETGVFLNRYFGEVRVGPGHRLVVDASADFRETLLGPGLEPLLNFGTIQVLGTVDARAELEFERAPNTEDQPIRPFFNRRVERPAGAPSTQFQGGLISAQHATLRFRSGIVNEGMMAFSAGANYVSGNVLNWCNPDDPEAHGIITVSGPGTKVTFENDLLNTSVLDISGGAVVEVLDRHSFLSADKLNVNLSLANPVPITVSGDVGLNGILNISLAGDITSTLKHGDSFEIISFAGQAYRAGIGDDGIPFLGDPLTQFAFPFQQVNVAPDIPWLARGLFPIVERIDQGIYLSFLGGPGSPGGPGDPDDPGRPDAVPPDFNGDGVVDELDLAIWLANVGIASGATVLQGDANGDGRIDGDDFLIWQRNVGMAPPWNGAGAGSGLPANVPEPSALVMLISGGLLALASRRRRSRC